MDSFVIRTAPSCSVTMNLPDSNADPRATPHFASDQGSLDCSGRQQRQDSESRANDFTIPKVRLERDAYIA